MRLAIPQSLAARTLAALTLGFAVLFVGMVGVHDILLRRAAERATGELLSQRLATLIDVVAVVPATDRGRVAAAVSGETASVRWQPEPFGTAWRPDGNELPDIERRTAALATVASGIQVRAGQADGGHDHLRDVNAVARLPDGSWVWVGIPRFRAISADQGTMHAYAAVIGLVLLLAVGFAARSVSRPLTVLAGEVGRLDPERDAPPLPVSGPREVRQLAEALNAMATRTRDAFRQRTLALGALSHDLMSPIARLRLRAEELPEEDRAPIQRDLAEMETMVSDVLAYLRGGRDGEPVRPLAVAALVRTVIAEFTDAGAAVEERHLDEAVVVEGRRVAIKRAVTNVLGNAVRHAARPWVEVAAERHAVVIRVGDSGPGIPAEDLPRVTDPFFRGDRARTAGGGSGLGLATARAIVEGHGGNLTVASQVGRGTLVTLRFPMRAPASGQSAVPQHLTVPGGGTIARA